MQAGSFQPPKQLTLRGALAQPSWTDAALQELASKLHTRSEVARVLVGRGRDSSASAQEHFDAKLAHLRRPEKMAGYEHAVEILSDAVLSGRCVGIFGDYDVDGISSCALIATYLQECGATVLARVAHREGGYGFGVDRAKELIEAGAQVIVTADCGTSDHEALAYCQQAGIPTVVIDHHQVPKERPVATAFLNPHQVGCEFSFKGMCSGGVGFYVCAGIRRRLAQSRSFAVPDPRELLDLVAMATVCDMMDLQDNNRILVRRGLSHLSMRQRPGVAAMLRAAGVPSHVPVDESHIGFVLGPRINAPGRLGSAQPALDLLLSRDPAKAQLLVREIEAANRRRKQHQKEIEQQCEEQFRGHRDDAAIVLGDASWLPGVVGIAASGLSSRHQRPALVLGQDRQSGQWRGSARSFGEVNVHAALAACAPLLDRFGGHEKAAGMSMSAQRSVQELREAFCAAVLAQGAASDLSLCHDGRLSLDAVNEALVDELARIGPYGVGFPEPSFLLEPMKVAHLKIVGAGHLSLGLCTAGGRRIPAIAFGAGKAPLAPGSYIQAVATPGYNDFAGRRSVQLRIERLWLCQEGTTGA